VHHRAKLCQNWSIRGEDIAIISASLPIKAEQSALVIDLSPVLCLSAHRYCGKMAHWIRMPFGVVSGVGLGICVLDFGGDCRSGRGSLGVNLWRPIVTNGDFVATIDSFVKSGQYFPTQNVSLNSVQYWLSYDIVRFKGIYSCENVCQSKANASHHQSVYKI